MTYKKVIEVALPLDTINRESARSRSATGTLHLWWRVVRWRRSKRRVVSANLGVGSHQERGLNTFHEEQDSVG